MNNLVIFVELQFEKWNLSLLLNKTVRVISIYYSRVQSPHTSYVYNI